METTGNFSLVCYQTAYGGGMVRNVIRTALSKAEAEKLKAEMDTHLETEDWTVEPASKHDDMKPRREADSNSTTANPTANS